MFFKYLEWIVELQKRAKFEISCVHTNDESLIAKTGIKSVTYEEVIADSDIVFSLGYWRKISKKDIDTVRLGIENFHHSYMLKFQGRHCADMGTAA